MRTLILAAIFLHKIQSENFVLEVIRIFFFGFHHTETQLKSAENFSWSYI